MEIQRFIKIPPVQDLIRAGKPTLSAAFRPFGVGFQQVQNVSAEAFHAHSLVPSVAPLSKKSAGVESVISRKLSAFSAPNRFSTPAELQHRAISALQAQRRQQRCAVRKQARRRGVLVFLRKRFVPLFENERMPNPIAAIKRSSKPAMRMTQNRGFLRSPSLAALGHVVLRNCPVPLHFALIP